MCWTDPFEFRWLKGLFITHLIILIKSEVSTFPIAVIFPLVVCLRWLYYHILSSITYIYPGNTGTLFPLLMFSLWYLQIIGYIGCVRLFADYDISLSSLCRLIWRHWTTKILSQLYNAECVSKIETILSIIFCSLFGAVCLQFTQLSCDDRENVYFILLSSSNRKYESLTIV